MLYRILQNYLPVQARTYVDDDLPGPQVLGPCSQSSAMFFSGTARTVGGYVTLDFNQIACAPQLFGVASFVCTPNQPDTPAIPPPPILITDIRNAIVTVRCVNTLGERMDTEFSWHCQIEIVVIETAGVGGVTADLT